MKSVAQFEIFFYQYLNEEGKSAAESPPLAQDFSHLLKLYRFMLFTRALDAKAVALQRTGKMGTYPSTRGQEAVFVGTGDALAPDDVFVPYYRDLAILMQRGVKPSDILLYWGGDERGNLFSSVNNLPYAVPIASQLLHAAGIATALKIRGEARAVLVTCGDGATSEGDFYEAMNVAGVWQLPIVFVVNNNQWAISVPRTAQTATETIAQKAIAAGFPGIQVDGNDVIAVRETVANALQKARTQQQPTLIEMLCYRQHDHTTADDASRYEPAGLRAAEWQKEPIMRLQRYLESHHALTSETQASLQADCEKEVEETVAAYLAVTAEQPLSSLFDYLYETLPRAYAAQRASLEE